jgi:glutathione reductase (NADPH)
VPSSQSSFDYDLLVIGAGSGGVRASRVAAQLGAKVAVVEERYLGGTCVNVGCVPKKLLWYGAHFGELFADAAGYGWEGGSPRFDWATLIANKDREISRLNGVYDRLLQGAGVEIVHGHATLTGPNSVQVGERSITARHILLAVGGWPWVPELPGREHVITSNEVFHLKTLPRRTVVVGGGYIAVEFAGIFHGLGSKTEVLYRGELFLRGFDDELRQHLAKEMLKKGVGVRFDTDVARVERRDDELIVHLKGGGTIACDCVLFATGRKPLLEGLGLESAGVAVSVKGTIIVDEAFRTNVDSIFAIGDAIGGMELTPLALAQGMSVAHNLFGDGLPAPDLDYIPTAIFSQPPMATVGFSEEQARKRFGNIAVFSAEFTPLLHTLSNNPERMLMKLIVDKASDRVVGAHMAGAEAGEIIQGLAVAIRAGATKAQFDATLGIHPTAAEEFVTMRVPVR